MCFHKSFFPSQALCPSYRGLSPSSRQDTRVSVRELSWRWSASFTPPGVSKNMTSVTAAGWKTAAYGFLSATPGSAVEASPKQECAHLDSLTRRSIFTAPTAIGSPKFLNKRKQIHFFLHRCHHRAVSPSLETHSIYSFIHQKLQLQTVTDSENIKVFDFLSFNQSYNFFSMSAYNSYLLKTGIFESN